MKTLLLVKSSGYIFGTNPYGIMLIPETEDEKRLLKEWKKKKLTPTKLDSEEGVLYLEVEEEQQMSGKEEMNEKQKQAIIKMVGTKGLEKLVIISALDSNTYKNRPYKLACHILWLGIKNIEKRLKNILEEQ